MTLLQETPPLDDLRKTLSDDPGGILELVAARHAVPLQTVVECLPGDMWTRLPGDTFLDVMRDIAAWGEVTVIVHTGDLILEFASPLPLGRTGHGFYNLVDGGKLGGHLRADHCSAIFFVRRPFMGKDTLSVQFFNAAGESMFKIFVGRDENRSLRADQVERFDALERRLAPRKG